MLLLRDLNRLPTAARGGAVSIGNFDGVHRGHAKLVDRLRRRADEAGGPAVVFTFDPHPATLLRPDRAPTPLTWMERRADLLAKAGADVLLACPTTHDLLSLSPREFFDRAIVDALDARALIEGPNFYFGKDRAGDVKTLRALCDERGMALEILDAAVSEGETISSSRIRRLLSAGAVGEAAALLTEPYRLRGRVVSGERRGRNLGFPTANLADVDTLIPGDGIYAGKFAWPGGERATAIHIGPNVTFGESVRKIECHLLDFSGDLYDAPAEVTFLARLREVQPFPSAERLIEALHADVARTREIVTMTGDSTIRPH